MSREEKARKDCQYCLFDLDGTLMDSGIGITNSVMYALRQFDICVEDRQELFCFIGPPLLESFMNYYGFSEEQALQAVGHYRVYYRERGIFENVVYKGIPQMLQQLQERGKTIALATSKPEEFAVQILKHFELFSFFGYIEGATMDGRVSRKEDVIRELLKKMGPIDLHRALMIGDRKHDIEGAKACALSSAGVLWGYGNEQELRKAGADYLVRTPEEILRLM